MEIEWQQWSHGFPWIAPVASICRVFRVAEKNSCHVNDNNDQMEEHSLIAPAPHLVQAAGKFTSDGNGKNDRMETRLA